LVVIPGSDGLGLLMEVPDLSLSSIRNLDDHVSVVNKVKVSVSIKLRNNIEVSFYIKTKLFIHLTFLWLRVLISVNNLKLLSEVSSFVGNLDVSVLSISVEVLVLNFNNLSFLVDNESTLISEDLPPS
jgi:hypothetical protein